MLSEIQFLKGHFANCLVGCFLLILLSCGTASALSSAGGGTWDYSRDILIQENSGNTLNDHSILIEFEEGHFPAEVQENGADIRFTGEDNNELNYWIEKFDSSTKKAKIWVKLPYVPANSQTKIKMYYGNPEANPVSNNVLRYPDVSGSWTGTLYQYDTGRKYSFNLDLSQDGSKIYGNSKIARSDRYYAVMEISGSIDDGTLNFKELKSIEEYSPNFNFFLKNVDLKFEDKFPSTLEGFWDCYWDSKTYGGTISLRRDISESVTNVTILEPQILSVATTKIVSPQSIRQFQESTITIKIENIGRTDITDIEVVDSTIPSSFDLVGENLHRPSKFDVLEPESTKEIQYTIRAKESGTFSLDPCTVTFADNERNIQEIKSEPVSLKVISSITEQDTEVEGNHLFSNFSLLTWSITGKNSLIKYIIIMLVSGVIFGFIIKKALKPSIERGYNIEEPASTPEHSPKIGKNVSTEDSNAKHSQTNSPIRDIIVGIIVTVIGIIIQKKFFP